MKSPLPSARPIIFGFLAALALGTLAACTTTTREPSPSSESTDAVVLPTFELFTHCGIDHALIRGTIYRAEPYLHDGNGNPPLGWNNPYQVGIMRVDSDGTATFTSGVLMAHFVLDANYVPPMCS